MLAPVPAMKAGTVMRKGEANNCVRGSLCMVVTDSRLYDHCANNATMMLPLPPPGRLHATACTATVCTGTAMPLLHGSRDRLCRVHTDTCVANSATIMGACGGGPTPAEDTPVTATTIIDDVFMIVVCKQKTL